MPSPIPSELADFLALPERRQDTIFKALMVLARLRRKEGSLEALAREEGTTVRTVRRYVGPGLRQTKGGRWRARPSDRLPRPMRVIATDGVHELIVRSSREASLNSRHALLAGRIAGTDPRAPAELPAFAGKTVAGKELETDQTRLEALARRGLLPPELYSHGH